MILGLLLAIASQDDFALNLFQQLRAVPGNVVVAPRNAVAALSLIRGYAGGAAAHEIDAALRGATAPRDPNVIDATAVWGDRQHPIDPARINAWVRGATNGKIDALISPGMVSSDTRLLLTAATYMKAQWRSEFSPHETRLEPFHLAGGHDVNVLTMKQELSARCATVADVQLLELAYANEGLSMLIALPNARDGLGAVERALTPALLAKWTSALKPRDHIALDMPRFQIMTEADLRTALEKLGVRRLFDARGAQLKRMSSDRPLCVSHAVQKVRIDVGEQGTEAAAAGEMSVITATMPLDQPRPIPFLADHPFLYIIRSHGHIVFLGRVANPAASR